MGERSLATNRRFTQIFADDDSPQRRRGRREWLFCLSGDDDKQKHIAFGDTAWIKH